MTYEILPKMLTEVFTQIFQSKQLNINVVLIISIRCLKYKPVMLALTLQKANRVLIY